MINFNNLRTISAFIAALLTITTTSFASPNSQLAKLLASDAAAGDEFGSSVAISGDTAIIGASQDDGNGSAYIFRFNGSTWTQEVNLTASDAAAGDRFGCSVAISGNTALIGAYRDDDNGSDSGSAYIFRYNGSSWTQEQKLTASDAAASDRFGFSVAISGDTALIGAYVDDDDNNGPNSGSAYIFRYNGSNWTQEEKLTAADAAADDQFGKSVAISGDTALVGADGNDDNGSWSGSAYIFRYNGSNWTQEQKLTASDAAASDRFGFSVAISGDTALIGAFGDDDNGSQSGSAYIFRYNGSTWTQEEKLIASDTAMSDWFGVSVAISGDTALIGAWNDDDNGTDSGSAYIFRYNGSTWPQESKLTAADAAADDYFGRSVAISGGTALIGAFSNDDDGSNSGSAYIFAIEGSTWQEKLLASDGAASDFFGWSVAISGDTAIIGAYFDDNNSGTDSGSAYIYRFNGTSWLQEAKLTASDATKDDLFGWSVAISGDTAIVGAYADNHLSWGHGSAYIFRYNGSSWIQEAKLAAPLVSWAIYFGHSVAISGDTALIGARLDDFNGTNSGSAYIFRYNGSTWVQEALLLSSDGVAYDDFGCAVAISGDSALVGARYDDDNGTDSGSAYIFRYDGATWVQEAKLLASDGAELDYFSYSVAISGDTALVGARDDDDNGSNSGSAYIYRYNGTSWAQENKLLASDGAEDDTFGNSVAISGDTAIIGANGNDDNGSASGSAYIFRYNGSTWPQESKLLASDGTTNDLLGISVAISGDSALLGAFFDTDNGSMSGSAYIFGLRNNPGNIDLDYDVDEADLILLVNDWATISSGRTDLNGDGLVDINDFAELANNFLKGTTP